MTVKKHRFLKAIGIFFGAVLLLAILLFAVCLITGKVAFEYDENKKLTLVIDNTNGMKDTYDQTVETINKNYPTDIFVYGEDCKFRKNVRFVQLKALSEEALFGDKQYRVIVINDMNQTADLTEADFDLLAKMVDEEKYSMVYIGKRYQELFVSRGFIEDYFEKEDLGFQIRNTRSRRISSFGIWTATEQDYFDNGSEELLGEIIIELCVGKLIRDE